MKWALSSGGFDVACLTRTSRPATVPPMHPILALAGALVLAAGASAAHGDPKDVTNLDVATYKASVESGCRDQGRRLGHPWTQVQRRCKCVVDTLESRVSKDEWKRATSFAQQRKEHDEAAVLAPHMAALKRCEGAAAR